MRCGTHNAPHYDDVAGSLCYAHSDSPQIFQNLRMAAKEYFGDARHHVVESAVLLRSLQKVPGPCTAYTDSIIGDKGHALTLNREQQVAEDFAFLAATTYEKLEVRAVAVEEHIDHSSLTLRIASNSGKLDKVVQGFSELCKILRDVCSQIQYYLSDASTSRAFVERYSQEAEQNVLRSIIKLSYERILKRLRSAHCPERWRRGKRPLIGLLNESLNQGHLSLVSSQGIKGQLRGLLNVFNDFERRPRPAPTNLTTANCLSRIIRAAKELNPSELTSMLSKIPKLEPSSVRKWPQLLKKIGRYSVISHRLVHCGVGKFSKLFQQTSVSPVVAPPGDLACMLPNLNFFEEAIRQRVHHLHFTSSKKKERNHLQGFKYGKLDEAQRHYSKCLSAPKQGRIHAEMQLVMHYEHSCDARKPRVIASNKKACYLCNLFLAFHQTFKLPETHGTIYDTWVPPVAMKEEVQTKFASTMSLMAQALDKKIQDTLFAPLRQLCPPSESASGLEQSLTSRSYDSNGATSNGPGISRRFVDVSEPSLTERSTGSPTSETPPGMEMNELVSPEFTSSASVEEASTIKLDGLTRRSSSSSKGTVTAHSRDGVQREMKYVNDVNLKGRRLERLPLYSKLWLEKNTLSVIVEREAGMNQQGADARESRLKTAWFSSGEEESAFTGQIEVFEVSDLPIEVDIVKKAGNLYCDRPLALRHGRNVLVMSLYSS